MTAPDATAPTRQRPARRRTVVDESWFGAFGATADSPALIEDSRFAASWQNENESGRERRRGSRTIAETTFERIFGATIFLGRDSTRGRAKRGSPFSVQLPPRSADLV